MLRTGLSAVTTASAAVGGSRLGAINSTSISRGVAGRACVARPYNHPRMKPTRAVRLRAKKVLAALAELYPDARCALDHQTPIQLLVATILSAQCTDVRVNLVTPALFARYKDAGEFAAASPAELEALIQSTGFFRNKARNIITCCRAPVERHGAQVPRTMEDLVPLAARVPGRASVASPRT